MKPLMQGMRLIILTEKHRRTKPNIKLNIGFKYTVVKIEVDADAPTFEEVTDVTTQGKQGICSTFFVEIYSVESVKPTIRNIKGNLESAFRKSLDSITGSGWSVKSFDTMFGKAHTMKADRGSSYIPTPTKLANPKSGLINIQNHDIECFKWCMKYHQSPQSKHSHRLTEFKKVEDKLTIMIYHTP